MTEGAPLVGIIMGSKSDWDAMRQADEMLTRFGVPHESRVMSAHRTPAIVSDYASGAADRGLQVIIAGAGGAAHLAGVVAAHTTLPVIGVPVGVSLGGLDALLATVQMPSGIPVATVAIGGAENAAILAAQILGVRDAAIQQRLEKFKADLAEGVKQKNLRLQKKVDSGNAG